MPNLSQVVGICDPNGDISSKRIFMYSAGLLYIVGFAAYIFGHPPAEYMMHDLMLIIGATVLGATVDHFAPSTKGGS